MRATIGKCRDGHTWILEDRGDTCPADGQKWISLRYTTREKIRLDVERAALSGGVLPEVGVFKPFTTDGFTGAPVRVESKAQRELLCKETHSTLDKCTNLRPPKQTPAIDTIDFGDVKRAIEHGVPESETQLDLPDAFE